MKEAEVNCVGFAYYQFCLQETDKFIEPPSYKELIKKFSVVTEEEADVIGIFTQRASSTGKLKQLWVHHLAITDPADNKFILHRESYDVPISRIPRKDLLKKYESNFFTKVYLKLKTPASQGQALQG